ncbi:S8 family serine peptidase [Salininema proteolyticum]|uniref:S8 family serine peptidase n=1 Tax=Salininema proteolyticum TaxID=1607685 RepID=A0ABV8U329_9ACTN
MIRPPRLRRRKAALATTATVALLGATALSVNAVFAEENGPSTHTFEGGRYIVQLDDEPVATYDGDVSGYEATAPEEGERLDGETAEADRYRDFLAERRAEVLDEVPSVETEKELDTVLNGFVAQLSADEAVALSKASGVDRIWRDEARTPDTSNTPDFLGMTGEGGVWEEKFGGRENAGEGVIVGVLDTGIWPENESFGELPEPRPDQDVIDSKWKGECVEGDDSAENNVSCNNKLIGARYYDSDDFIGNFPDLNYASPRDAGGHGSHTAGTAAGNYGVDAGEYGEVSGMAPAARVAAYKVCWENGAQGSCSSANTVAAVEDAVNDGVDVINYSVGGSREYVVDSVNLAFFNAAAAGVFVAASAGNSGADGPSTVAHNSPWITTVAASTHDRFFDATLTLGDGTSITGAGKGEAVPETAAVLASEVGKDGVDAKKVTECHKGSLDPEKVDGLIVACARGSVARVEKSQEVADAGGVGMIHYNVEGGANDIAPDSHAVPTIHVEAKHADTITDYLSSADEPTVALGAGEQVSAKAPQMAGFSSYGPALAGEGDLLKPDITAPGVDVVAAVSPTGNDGHDFASYQGTSMSSPHIAGLAALMVGDNPEWSPMTVKSAMMTTAYQNDNRDEPIQRAGEDATPLDYGAGHVAPGDMFDPGLVYESGAEDWLAYGCALGQIQLVDEVSCETVEEIDPSDLNYPSISVGELAGEQTIVREVTNVSDETSTYEPSVEAPEGFEVSINKKSIKLKPGKSKKFKVTITRTDAAYGEYAFGSVTWKDSDGHEVRSPIAVKPVPVAVANEVHGDGTDGGIDIAGVSGYTGTLNTEVSGLTASTVDEFTLSNPEGGSFPADDPQENDHVKAVEVTVPEGAHSRFATFQSDQAENTDLDLFVYRKGADGLELVGASAAASSDEAVTLDGRDDETTYVVFVDLWGGPASEQVKFHSWIVDADEGNTAVEPASSDVSVGEAFSVNVAWTGLETGERYLGAVTYSNGDGTALSSTMVNVTTG